MRIAFYAPMNPPDSPVFSGDALMARQIITLLNRLGHHVIVVSRFRSWMREPGQISAIATAADIEIEQLTNEIDAFAPELWFTYHLYYRAPDLIGPVFTQRLRIPYVVAEASHASRRLEGPWAEAEKKAVSGLQAAKVILALTQRDMDGLARCAGITGTISHFPPFMIEIGQPSILPRLSKPRIHKPRTHNPRLHQPRLHQPPVQLVCVAMMRQHRKLECYQLLAQALSRISCANWRLRIIGGGSAQADVQAAFAGFDTDQVHFVGVCHSAELSMEFERADIFVWPGFREAYGMVYLEAQERGLPVVAMDSGGVSSVVRHGVSGLLSPEGDVDAFADAILTLIENPGLRQNLGSQARAKVLAEHGPDAAMQRLREALDLAIN